MNQYLKNLNRIEFVVTMACTGKCRHCSQGEHRSNENIDKYIAADAVRKIAEKYNITSVMTFGGEPLLYPETVCAIHRAASEMKIPKRQLITNGYFSKDPEKIRFVVRQLIESGVNEILLSVDAFHQETIPLDFVKIFAEEVKKHNIKFLVHPAWLVSAEDENSFNLTTREILSQFNAMDIPTGEGNVIFPAGNAVKYLAEYFEKDKIPENPYVEDPYNIKAVCFSASGDILGSNINKQKIEKILADYSPE